MTVMADRDVRFSVPLYTQAEAARYLAMPASTLKSWTHRYERPGRTGKVFRSPPLVTHFPNELRGMPSVPFIGLAEAVFLAALRRANVPLQQIRPALQVVQKRIGVAHALASKRLYLVGAQLLWEVSEDGDLDPSARTALIVLKNNQYVFREVVEQYLKRIEYASDGYAGRVALPGYEVANVVADPNINFGQPFFASTGAPIEAILSRLRAGESIPDVAEDFDLRADEVTEVADRQLTIA